MTDAEKEWWQENMELVKTGSSYEITMLFYRGWLYFNWTDKRLHNLLKAWWDKYGVIRHKDLLK